MFEVERKYRVDELQKYLELLQEMHAEDKGQQKQHDEVFLPKGIKTFKNYTIGMPIVRIRIEDQVATLTLKAGGDESFTHEIETEVKDSDAARGIIKALGMEKVLEITKTRQLFSYQGFTIACDYVEKLGAFIEVEKLVENEADVREALEEIDAFVAHSLWLGSEMLEKERYDVLIERQQAGNSEVPHQKSTSF
jgi:adenylate cyclase class 2